MRVSAAVFLSMIACPSARAFVGPRRCLSSSIALRGGSSETAVAEAVSTASAKELYPELVKKLETITHLGMFLLEYDFVSHYTSNKFLTLYILLRMSRPRPIRLEL